MGFRNITRVEWIVFAVLITLGVACRFLIDTPNVKPIAAFALLGGFMFRKPALAVVAVIAMLALSDLRLGFYQWQLLTAVYLSLGLSVGLGCWIRRRLGNDFSVRHWLHFFGASLVMSTFFFLMTNAAVWWTAAWYPANLAGLAECYVAAIPFYRLTLQGDLMFTIISLGSYSTAIAASKWMESSHDSQLKPLVDHP